MSHLSLTIGWYTENKTQQGELDPRMLQNFIAWDFQFIVMIKLNIFIGYIAVNERYQKSCSLSSSCSEHNKTINPLSFIWKIAGNNSGNKRFTFSSFIKSSKIDLEETTIIHWLTSVPNWTIYSYLYTHVRYGSAQILRRSCYLQIVEYTFHFIFYIHTVCTL